MVTVIAARWALYLSPPDRTSLRRDHDNFGSLLQKTSIDERRRYTKRTTSADINGLELIRKVKSVQSFHLFFEITCVID
jgi:hypothetical protein